MSLLQMNIMFSWQTSLPEQWAAKYRASRMSVSSPLSNQAPNFYLSRRVTSMKLHLSFMQARVQRSKESLQQLLLQARTPDKGTVIGRVLQACGALSEFGQEMMRVSCM